MNCGASQGDNRPDYSSFGYDPISEPQFTQELSPLALLLPHPSLLGSEHQKVEHYRHCDHWQKDGKPPAAGRRLLLKEKKDCKCAYRIHE
jgi:hypothetical protein